MILTTHTSILLEDPLPYSTPFSLSARFFLAGPEPQSYLLTRVHFNTPKLEVLSYLQHQSLQALKLNLFKGNFPLQHF